MNLKCRFICFEFLIFCLCIGTIVTNAVRQNDETSKIIEVESERKNLTLPCHPKLQNSIQNATDFEWFTDNDIPIFSNGRLSPFLFLVTLEPLVSVVNTSLIISDVPSENVTFTCRLTRLHINYTYFIRTTKMSSNRSGDLLSFGRYILFGTGRHISFGRKGETVTLPCLKEKDIGFSTAGTSFTWQLMNNKENSIETISLNQRIILRNNSVNFRVTEDRSLIVPNFIPNYRIEYECHLSTGHYVSYYTNILDQDTDDTKIPIKKKSIAVGRRNSVTLSCSAVKSGQDFVWIRNNKNLLSIGNSVIKSGENDNFKIDTDGRSLTIANFSSSFSGIYTCVTRNGPNYLYNVTEQKSIYRTIFAEPRKEILLDCSISNDEDESKFVWVRNENEVLFINGLAVAGSESNKLRIADDKRSLVITEFSNILAGVYVCQLTTGIDYTYNITISNSLKFKNQTIFADFGTKDLVLQCPVVNEAENASSEWIVENTVSKKSPSLLFFNKEKFLDSLREYYEIKDDRSLVIRLLTYITYGVYTCRWSTGEQYTYNVTFQTNFYSITIWANQGENVGLLCQMQDPRDREFNVVNWSFMIIKAPYSGDFQFTDGKMFHTSLRPYRIKETSSFRTLPNSIELAHDKRSLLISNITSDLQGYYICDLIRSSTTYHYTVMVKDT